MRIYPRGKRGTLWAAIDIDGQQIRRSTGTSDKRQAQEYAARLAADLWRQAKLGERPRVTWDTACIEWVADHAHLKSIEDAKRLLRWLSARLRGVALADITAERIRVLAVDRKAEKVGTQPTANATVNRHLAALSSVLHYAHRRGYVDAVPAMEKLHEPKNRVRGLTPDEARALLAELPPHLRAMAAFALATGLRESNVRLLCWQQVDLTRQVAWVYADQAKAGKDIAVPLNADAMAVLQAQQGVHTRWVFPVPRWLPKAHPDDAPQQVWDAPTGKISNHAWRKACARAGLDRLRFHDLRHTWASWHAAGGTPPLVLKELGGWASLAMVERYSHLAPGHVSAWSGNASLSRLSGTNPGTSGTKGSIKTGSRNADYLGKPMGWLMGLEPTTTGITRRSKRGEVLQINDLAKVKGRKVG